MGHVPQCPRADDANVMNRSEQVAVHFSAWGNWHSYCTEHGKIALTGKLRYYGTFYCSAYRGQPNTSFCRKTNGTIRRKRSYFQNQNVNGWTISINYAVVYGIFTRTWLTLRSGLCCRNSICHLSVCLSSVTLVHPTQEVEAFGNISSPLCTLAILWPPCKILRR